MANNKLKEIVSLCKCSVSIMINDHKAVYQTAAEEINQRQDWVGDTEKEIIDKMIEMDNIVTIQCYPNTPVGFYVVNHYDLDIALDVMLKGLKENHESKKKDNDK